MLGRTGRRHGPRSFDPVRLGSTECDAWAAYYRREWRPLLVASLGLVRLGFGTGPVATLRGALRLDPVEASRREVDRWRVHRAHQREAARLRGLAMRYSDKWVAAGRDRADPLLARERNALIDSYASLLAAVSTVWRSANLPK